MILLIQFVSCTFVFVLFVIFVLLVCFCAILEWIVLGLIKILVCSILWVMIVFNEVVCRFGDIAYVFCQGNWIGINNHHKMHHPCYNSNTIVYHYNNNKNILHHHHNSSNIFHHHQSIFHHLNNIYMSMS